MRQTARTFLLWSLFFAIFWLLLTGASGLLFGGISALAAAAIATWVGLPLLHLRLAHLPGFAGFFLAQLWLGGWDVARRALAPTLASNDGWVQYTCAYPSPRVQLLLSASVGLLPGTLSTGVNMGVLDIHALD